MPNASLAHAARDDAPGRTVPEPEARARRSRRPQPIASAVALFALLACTTAGAAPRAAPGAALGGPPAPARNPLDSLRASIDSMATAPQFANAFWGILIVDPATGDTLYSRNAGKLFMPASNMKIVTGAVALAQLGADYRFRTTMATRGVVRGDTLVGDLVVYGRGDPSASEHMRGDALAPLREMADSLAARGIRRITGRLVSGADVFPGAGYGLAWSWDDFVYAYSAPVQELYFNEGFDTLLVRGGARAGDSATIVGARRLGGYPPVALAVVTGDSAGEADIEPLAPTAVGDTIRLAGTVPPGDTTTVEIVFPDQETAYFAALRQAFSERGIEVGGAPNARAPYSGGTGATPIAAGGANRAGVPVTAPRLPASARAAAGAPAEDTLFTYLSPPLRDVLPALLKPSQNQIAEILVRTLGLERTGVGTPDSGLAVVRSQLERWEVDSTGSVIVDGSGLSRLDYLTPESIVRTLAAIRQDSAFSVFYNALPIAGVDGTIENRMRGTPAEGAVRAKTGFISNARSLSGYVTTRDGRMLIFSVLCNNWTAPRREVDRVQDRIGAGLAALDLARARALQAARGR